MIQLFALIGQIMSNPQTAQLAVAGTLAVRRTFDRLSPESKAKVAAIIRWGVERAARFALTAVLGEVGGKVIDAVADPAVAEFAKTVVERGVEIGVEAALKESRVSA